MKRCIAALILILVSGFFQPVWADGFIIVDHPEIRPRIPELPNHPQFAPLWVKSHRVDVEITEQVAVTQIDQVFHNPYATRLEGTFMFPVPEGVLVDRFSMRIDGKRIEAELLEAEKARKIYEDIVRRMRDPALLEYVNQRVFKVRVFPIEPNSDKRITLRYTQVLSSNAGIITYTYPLDTERFSSKPISLVRVRTTLSVKHAIGAIYSPSHPVEVIRRDSRQAEAVFEAENVKPDRNFRLCYSIPETGDEKIDLSLLSYNPDEGEDGFFLLLATPTSTRISGQRPVPKDMVFVLDTSGSMLGKKLDQAKRALRYCVKGLDPEDRFDVIRFSTEAQAIFGELVRVDKGTLRKAEALIDKFRARGGTALSEALLSAVTIPGRASGSKRPLYVILITDGHPTIGEIREDEIVRTLKKELKNGVVRIFCFGVGTEINTHLLDKIAEDSRGATTYVLPDENIETAVSAFYERIANPVMSDVRIRISRPVRISRTHPSSLPDLFAGDQMIVTGRYSGSGSARISLSGTIREESVTLSRDLIFPNNGKAIEYDFVARLWAVRRVGYLLDQIRINGESGEIRNEIVRIAKRYGIVTPYTSYLILEDASNRPIPQNERPVLMRVPKRGERAYRETLRSRYEGFRNDKSGYSGVGSAKAASVLKQAPSAATAITEADRASELGVSREPGETVSSRPLIPPRFIRGKTFFFNGEEWVDAEVSDIPLSKFKLLSFASHDYFELLRTHPDAHAWLSVGRRVRLSIGNTFFVVK